MSEAIKRKAIKGTLWSFADNILNQGITFLVGIVLARILTPQEYGLIGIIMIFIAVFNNIADSGFSSALIRKNDASDEDYNTVFIVNLVVSLLLSVVLFILSPAIAVFFNQPQLQALARTMSVVIVINALGIIQRTILVKKVDFKTQTKISLIASMFSGVVGITLALTGFGVWSLVGQQISRQSINTVFLWIWSKWYPKFMFSIKSFKELFGFGWKILVSGLIDTIWKEIYQVVIGKFYNTTFLGYYTRAKQFDSIFSSNLTAVVQRVSYPILSEIQDDMIKLKSAYKRIISVTMLVSFCCMLGLASVARPMIITLIGEQWLPCVPMLQILSFQLMLYPLHALNLNMLQVQGRSDLFLKLEIIKKIIAICPLVLGIFVGIYWMLIGSVITSVVAYFINAYYSGKFLNYGVGDQIRDITPSFTIAFVMAIIVYAISFINCSQPLILIIQLVIGIMVVILLCEVTRFSAYMEIKNVLTSYINTVRNGK